MAIKSKGRGYIAQEREKPEEKPKPQSRIKNAKITSIYLDIDLHEELRKISFVKRVTITSIIEDALREYLKTHKL